MTTIFRTYGEIKQAPFNVQVHTYRTNPILGLNVTSESFLEDLDIDGLDKAGLKAIEQGKTVPDDRLTERMAEVFMLWSDTDAQHKKYGCRDAFFLAAHRARTFSDILHNFAAMKDLKSDQELAETLGVPAYALQRNYFNNKPVAEYNRAKDMARRMGFHGEYERIFMQKAGSFFADDHHVFAMLERKEIGMPQAIRGLCQNHDGSVKAAMERMRISRPEQTKWLLDEPESVPSRDRLFQMVGPDGFNFQQYGDHARRYTELLFESAGRCIDEHHVATRLQKKEITFYGEGGALRQLVSMHYPMQKDYAASRGITEKGAIGWLDGYIPRAELLALLESAAYEDKRTILTAGGYFLDGKQVIETYKDSHDFHKMLEDIKSTYDLRDEDLGRHSHTVGKLRRLETTPSPETFVSIFKSIVAKDSSCRECWRDYKQIAARFLGYEVMGRAYMVFDRKMNDALTAVGYGGPGAG